MREKTNLIFLRIVFCFALIIDLCIIQSCKEDKASAATSESHAIAAVDLWPSWSPDGEKIAFTSKRGGNTDIYIMNANGSDQTRLTEELSEDTSPSWSPDSEKIVFDSDRDGNFEIYTINSDGSNPTRLTDDPARDNCPSWSPDGTKIAFQSLRDGNMDIYTLDIDSTEQIRLTDNPAPDVIPSWSPDGKKIAFISARDGNAEIYIMNADGSDQTRLTDNPTLDLYPSWSPNGKKISFNSERKGENSLRIYTMYADGSEQSRLTDNPFYEMFSSWSPDGTKIAFITEKDFNMEVYVMNVDGSNPINLTNNAPVNATFGLAPQPKSELDLDEIPYKIVYESFRETDGKENWEICQINANGSNFVNLTNTPEIDEMYPHVSPDGRRICFETVEGKDKESKSRIVYVMNIDGSDRKKIAANANQPCWSPDGRFIAYLPGEFPRYEPDVDANKGLEIYNLETGEKTQHPNEEISHIWCLNWSPDREWFVAAGPPICAYKADDKTRVNLRIPGCTPDISPDGKQLAWNGTNPSLWIGDLDFDSPQSIVTNQKVIVACDSKHWVFHSDWSPDMKYILFSYIPHPGSDQIGKPAPGSNICICDLSTNKWTLVTTDGKSNKEPDWVPLGEEK